jgi:hypothetical protein
MVEEPKRMTMLESGEGQDAQEVQARGPQEDRFFRGGLLPAVELMEQAAEESTPLPRKDVLELADACAVSEIDLNMVAPEFSDV